MIFIRQIHVNRTLLKKNRQKVGVYKLISEIVERRGNERKIKILLTIFRKYKKM